MENVKRNKIQEATIATGKLFDCEKCSKSFIHHKKLQRHIDKKHSGLPEPEWKCEHCNKNFVSSTILGEHIRNIHLNPDGYGCELCNQRFSTMYSLKTHELKQHSDAQPTLQCSFEGCQRKFYFRYEINRHVKSHIIDKPKTFKCSEDGCEQMFTRRYEMKRHVLRIHVTTKNVACPFEGCNKKFVHESDMLLHLKRHEIREQSYTCDLCQAKFISSQNMKSHKKLVHSVEKNFACLQCGHRSRMQAQLNTHVREVHTHNVEYKCEQCGKVLRSNSKLKAHIKNHDDTRPFQCAHCNKSFKQKHSMQRHEELLHTDIKKFSCPHCSFKNNLKHNMVAHMDNHERQASYPLACEMQDGGTQKCQQGDVKCTTRCKTLLDMDIHIERNHTPDGIASKFESEAKLAQFFDCVGALYDRDWLNNIKFTHCKAIVEGNRSSARPDFYLIGESARLNAIVICENDEYCHRREACDFQRVYNLVNVLEQDPNQRGVPILLLRLNPHHFTRDGVYCSRPLHEAHMLMWKTLQSISEVPPGVNLIYIQYDSTNGVPDVFTQDENNDFAKLYRSCLMKSI